MNDATVPRDPGCTAHHLQLNQHELWAYSHGVTGMAERRDMSVDGILAAARQSDTRKEDLRVPLSQDREKKPSLKRSEETGDLLGERKTMSTPKRIAPRDAHRRVAWEEALLVCANDSQDRFQQAHLYGAISLDDFKSRIASLSKDQEIIFYGDQPHDDSVAGRAAEYQKQGFANAMVLAGDAEAWTKAGYTILETAS